MCNYIVYTDTYWYRFFTARCGTQDVVCRCSVKDIQYERISHIQHNTAWFIELCELLWLKGGLRETQRQQHKLMKIYLYLDAKTHNLKRYCSREEEY